MKNLTTEKIKEILSKNLTEYMQGMARCNCLLSTKEYSILRDFINTKAEFIKADIEEG